MHRDRSLVGLLVIAMGCGIAPSELPSHESPQNVAPLVAPPLPLLPTVQPPPPSGAADITSRHFTVPLSVRDAETILAGTKIFVWNHGPAMQIYAYNVILRQTDAHARMLAIARHGERAGQLYALCALRELEAPGADSLSKRLRSINEQLWVYDGWMIEATVSAMVQTIEGDKVWRGFQLGRAGYRYQ